MAQEGKNFIFDILSMDGTMCQRQTAVLKSMFAAELVGPMIAKLYTQNRQMRFFQAKAKNWGWIWWWIVIAKDQ